MPHKPLQFISPSYPGEKLDSPSYGDLVDVFEDRMRGWLLTPVKHLLRVKHGYVAAVSLSMGYFEGIEIYCSGTDSAGKSKQFFRRGFKRVFGVSPNGAEFYDQLVDALYAQARCGFAHDGMFRYRVFFSTVRPQALSFTWPRKDGQFIKDGHVESVIVNPERFFEGIEVHFGKYVAALREESDLKLKESFLAAVELKWALKEPEPFVGIEESEFVRGA